MLWLSFNSFRRRISILNNNILHGFNLNSDYDQYERNLKWCNEEIILYIENCSEDIMKNLLFIAKELINRQFEWDEYARTFISMKMLDSINYWREDDEEQFTIKEIIGMLYLQSILITKDSNFIFSFDDKIIFRNHSSGRHYLLAEGNINDGFYEYDVSSD